MVEVRRRERGNKTQPKPNGAMFISRHVGVLLASVLLANGLSSSHLQGRASFLRFLPALVSSGRNQHRLPDTPPDQAKARFLQYPYDQIP